MTTEPLEQVRRDLAELATILAGFAKDRATFERLAAITHRHSAPDELSDDERPAEPV